MIIYLWGKSAGYKHQIHNNNIFIGENAGYGNYSYNYATEKLWDALICECLPFYWGCPNLEEYLDPLCFVRLDLNDIPGSIEIIKKAMKEDWWSQRINIIRREKEKVINELGFFPNLAKIIKTHEKRI